MHMEIVTEKNPRKIRLFCAYMCTAINDYSRLFVDLLLSIKILCEHNLFLSLFGSKNHLKFIDFGRYKLAVTFYLEENDKSPSTDNDVIRYQNQ